MTATKTLPLPLPGSVIHYNHASLQLLKSGQHGVRIRFNARGDHWQMLNAPQNGGPVGGLLVVITNPEAIDSEQHPNVVVISRILDNGTTAFGELTYNSAFPDAKSFSSNVAGAHTSGSMSPDAVLQAAYDRAQEARKGGGLTGRASSFGQQVRRRLITGTTRGQH